MKPSMTVLAVALLASACSPAGGAPAATDTTAVTETRESIDLNDLAEVLFIDEAEHFRIERTIHACMTETGFDYNIGWYFPYDIFEDAPWRVVANPPPEVEYDNEEVDEFRRAGNALALSQVGWRDALFGTEREFIDLGSGGGLERQVGGCLDQGWAPVVGDPSVWHELFGRVQGIQGEAYMVAQAAPAAQLAADAWMRCMQSRGYDATLPDDLSPEWAELPGAERASEDCRDESALGDVLSEEHGSMSAILLQWHAPTLDPLLAILFERIDQ